MGKVQEIIVNRHKNGELYKFWLWPWLLLCKITWPIHPGVYFLDFVVQRIFRINSKQKFKVHYTSYVNGDVKIGKNVWLSFATSGGCYIQGDNGIEIGDNTIFAPGIKIISANHDSKNISQWVKQEPVKIGKKCWIGANAVILPGVELGDNVIVGAGAVVTKSFPENVVIAGNPAKVIKENIIA